MHLHTWGSNFSVVVRIHTDEVFLQRKRIRAMVKRTQFMVTLKVRPTPKTAVDHVRKTFALRYLQSAVKRSGGKGLHE